MSGIDLLRGTRLVDLAGDAASYTGRLFADLGADVVLVEPPGGRASRRDAMRFAHHAAGKRSVTIDLDHPEGRALLVRLLAVSDVLTTTAEVGELDALGLGYDDVRAECPRLVYTSVTAFGLTGPRRRWRGSDLVGWATSGALPAIGDPDRAPVAPGGGIGHMTAALTAAMGAMAALAARRQTGVGQLVDISVQESVISVAMEAGPMMVLEGGFTQHRTGNRRAAGPNGHYPTSDGAVCVVAYMPEHWRALAEWVAEETGVEEVTSAEFSGSPIARLVYADLIDTWVEGLTRRYTKQGFFEEAQRRGITVAPVHAPADVLGDPHLAATGGWQHGQVSDGKGQRDVRVPTPPVSVDGAIAAVGPVPSAGEHNREVFAAELGIPGAELDRLCSAGVICAKIQR